MSGTALVGDLLTDITKRLDGAIPRPEREAQLLLMHHLSCDELWLLTNRDSEVKDLQSLYAMVQRRAQNEPLEYLTNRVSFYSREFFIAPGALIPRPETELLIDEVLACYPQKEDELQFVEVGVGSGIISIMLALLYPNAKFIGVDISLEALAVAKQNREKFGLQKRIELRHGSLLDVVEEEVDYLVSNPPYIAADAPLESNLSYEPQNALFGGVVGDEIIKELLNEVLKRKINFFSCEIGYDQKDRITNYLRGKSYQSLEFYKDLSGFDRGFTLRIQDEA